MATARDAAQNAMRKSFDLFRRKSIKETVIKAAPHEANILEWHYVVEESKGTPYERGFLSWKTHLNHDVNPRRVVHPESGVSEDFKDKGREPCLEASLPTVTMKSAKVPSADGESTPEFFIGLTFML